MPMRAPVYEQAPSNMGWRQRIDLSFCLPIGLLVALCGTTLAVAAVANAYLHNDVAAALQTIKASHLQCAITFAHNMKITPLVIDKEATKEGWPLTHPHGPNCVCGANRRPVWLAPGDICTIFNLSSADWKYCNALEFSGYEHILVCVSDAQLRTMWGNGLCQGAPANTVVPDGVELLDHDQHRVNVALDGRMFCIR